MKYTGRIATIGIFLVMHSFYLLYDALGGGSITMPEWLGYPLFTVICYWAGLQFDRAVFHSERDPLTGLYNRRNTEARITRMMAAADRAGHKVFVLAIDCDNFKWINDTLNHQTGDTVLIEISKILLQESNKRTIAVRWGGDEFLLCGLCSSPSEVEEIKLRIKNGITRLSGKMNLPVNISIGSAIYPDDDNALSMLITLADRNMYNQKKS
ncbi:diguanylate cyclase (GGDEF)-like protein [Paenibacillus forsythiae]|uniref:Diguanylate cyclase (GGDEF)-like protein n=1 Tax=Paenibacillus forsythiae TaxID=365616 RepID=A0ABU3HA82_9BACL|nr:GGDEF domain-containing protein [Paenibacillus forsythiae]MDT3427625.1 diguanylate cyclase (GGDEF)-like protein [Paenibacillus forsythiae]